jgi:ATP-dependent DNA ligase
MEKTMGTIRNAGNLFSRDTTGKVRVWCMEQRDESYRTISGVLNGELVTSEWTVAEVKNAGRANATTVVEQSQKEIESRYTKQLKLGYHKNISDIDNFQFVEPMLAKSYNDYADKIDFCDGRWLLQTKLNGMRLVATRHGLFTRKGEKFVSIPHIQESLKPFFEQYPDAVLDGECFNEELRQQLNEIVSLARKTKNVSAADLRKSREIIKYYIYDGYGFTNQLNEDAPYSKRKAWIDANVAGKFEYTLAVSSAVLDSLEMMQSHYDDILALGHEGGILRHSDAAYEHKRSKGLLKVKPEDTDDFYIVDIKEGSGNWSGKAKIISLRSQDGSMKFDATFQGTMEDATKCLREREKWLGKLVEIKYNGLTAYNVPQYAQMNYLNCLKGDR